MAMDYLSPPEVATLHDIPIRTVQTACQTGRLQAERIGRFYLIHPEHAEEFASRHRSRRNGHKTS